MQQYIRFGFRICGIVLLAGVFLSCPRAWSAEPGRPDEPLARVFSELFQDPERNTRLEACFLSVGLPERPEHVRILRHNLADADPVERIVTLYALAAMTRAPEDVDAFLAALPEEPQLFLDVGSAEWDLSTSLGTGMADFLLLLVHEPRTRDRALPHLARIILNNGPAETLDAEARDPLVKPYLEAHGNSLVLKKGGRISYEPGKNCETKIRALTRGDDPDSRIAALLMYRHGSDPERLRGMEEEFRRKNIGLDAGQAALLKMAVNYESFLETFPTDRATVENILRTEKRLYKPPFGGVARMFLRCREPFAGGPLKALLRYGDGWLEGCERYYLQARVKGE